MNREILFRGKRLDNGEWVEGAYCSNVCDGSFTPMIERPCIVDLEFGFWDEVDPNTLSQFTGLYDKNNVRIFEGDIFRTNNSNCELWTVDYIRGAFCAKQTNANYYCVLGIFMMTSWVEVIGDIYDNPELLDERLLDV